MRFTLAVLFATYAAANKQGWDVEQEKVELTDSNDNEYAAGVDNLLELNYSEEIHVGNVDTTIAPADFFDGEDWNPMSLDGIDGAIHSWFQDKALPFYNVHKAEILGKAMADAEEKHGKLLGTCAKGQACQQERKAELVIALEDRWRTFLNNFNDPSLTP